MELIDKRTRGLVSIGLSLCCILIVLPNGISDMEFALAGLLSVPLFLGGLGLISPLVGSVNGILVMLLGLMWGYYAIRAGYSDKHSSTAGWLFLLLPPLAVALNGVALLLKNFKVIDGQTNPERRHQKIVARHIQQMEQEKTKS